MEFFPSEFDVCPHCGYVVGTPAEEAIHMAPSTLLHDRYIVGKVLGYGGFGVTYIGWDGKLEQKVAIKEYLPGEFSTRMPGQTQVTVFNGDKNEQFYDGLKKFVEEAKHLAKFQNESGIVKIFDGFEENDTAYIVMEYLDGETLTDYLRRVKTIPEDEAVEMLTPAMMSLKVVHEEGLLHRDIAPDNIFLTKDNEVKLIDFGASRYATTSHSRSLTVIIKPGYSPEEQYRSRSDQGPHTDVYAMAATLYKMITGITPPDAMERRAKYEKQNKDVLQEPHKIDKKISINRENAILNAMNVRIEDRTPDIGAFLDELNADPPAKRRYGKIKKIDIYSWPIWLKILVPLVLAGILCFGGLLATGVIEFGPQQPDEIIIPEGFEVAPDVEGSYMEEALAEIQKSNLLPATAGNIESEYVEAGKIILQSPTGGAYLETNGTVFLTVSAGKGVEEVVDGVATMPYIIWDKIEDAVEKIKAAGLGEPVIEEVNDESVAEGCVVSVDIEAGEQLEAGTIVTIKVSKGAAAFKIPNVKGLTASEAVAKLEKLGLVVNVEYKKDNNVAENNVISQNIAANTEVKRGDTVKLVVSSGKDTVSVANVVGKSAGDAKSLLKSQGFKVSELENYSDTVAAGNVISQSPNAGSAQIPGATIVIIVSKGKQPVTVSFNGNGGAADSASITVYNNNAYGSLPSAKRTGYSFNGWFTAPSGGSQITSSSKVSVTSANQTLYAQWTANSYTVSFDANGGNVSTKSKNVQFGAAYGDLPIPSKAGSGFSGWYTSKTGGSPVSASAVVSVDSNHTLYARWEANAYTVTLDPNGGSVSTTSITVKNGSTYGSIPTPAKSGCTFNGWYTAKTGGTKITADTVATITSAQTLYAQWTVTGYTITFDANGGKVSVSNVNVKPGNAIGTLPVPTRDYYKFLGWYTAKSGGTKVTSATKNFTADSTLYARWIENTVSSWVKAESMPADARITNTKWTYTETEYQESDKSMIFGWIMYEKKRTDWGPTQGPVDSDPKNGERNVWSEEQGETVHHYKYYHNVGGSWQNFGKHEIDITYALTQKTSQFGGFKYYGDYKCPSCNQTNTWIPNGEYDKDETTTVWYYQEPVYTYYHKKDATKESTTDPTGTDGISNIQKWVQYVAK